MNKLKELRKEKGLTQVELAHEIGTTKLTVSNWENEKHVIKSDKAQALADYFGVSVGYLLGYATVDDVMELTAKVMTNQIRLEDISDKNTRKAVSDYIELNKGLEPNQPFKTDYSMLNAIEKINDIKLVDEMMTDSMLANRVLDRLRSYMMESGIISPDSYNWEIERVMTWLIDFNDELFKRKVSLSGGKISSPYSQDYRNNDLYKTDNDS
ncbi:helix-turn-helix transcriptional regulator [Streptococcus agalactiae]|uniref:helix-turn-helix transcriptional regulator n=1 Tax=Streptococcus agalactiae TaxID=1311 RepID=UPI0002BB593F|nr:helix-turn-helix domain-containing protein [Streptococcus agalactiae]EPX11582.1 transcriptional regulator [Streptococcus agalactiae LDS 610]EPU41453.1 transcriptional regulator [Streptococcus agalactiae LDS 628]EPU42154.1 transcriptional regulator [Streptococcus agalactiae LDS 617]EPX12662.1 transcriptional regulator [Streptococcus agalactiae LDS 623]MBE3600993.1 helix-turn-helix transcriptional regulator [Streptococcus agalactiae]